MPGGDYSWYVQTWSPAGYGPWSGGDAFTIQTAVPNAIALISPAGTAPANVTQRYTWKTDPAAAWYELYITRNGSLFLDQWFSLTNSVVDSATGDFVVDVSGGGSASYRWSVRAWSPDGYGAWSDAMSFQIP